MAFSVFSFRSRSGLCIGFYHWFFTSRFNASSKNAISSHYLQGSRHFGIFTSSKGFSPEGRSHGEKQYFVNFASLLFIFSLLRFCVYIVFYIGPLGSIRKAFFKKKLPFAVWLVKNESKWIIVFAHSSVVLTQNMKMAIIAGSAALFYKTSSFLFEDGNRPFHSTPINNGTEWT